MMCRSLLIAVVALAFLKCSTVPAVAMARAPTTRPRPILCSSVGPVRRPVNRARNGQTARRYRKMVAATVRMSKADMLDGGTEKPANGVVRRIAAPCTTKSDAIWVKTTE
uniref:Secreted protein n=1 Tax=Arundo donax TaxID=35708 RepID=A0A0A9DYX0_ARUDO